MELPLHQLWRDLGARLAVAGGAGTALAELVLEVPVRAAALRGALVFAAIVVVTRLVAAGLERNESVASERGARRG